MCFSKTKIVTAKVLRMCKKMWKYLRDGIIVLLTDIAVIYIILAAAQSIVKVVVFMMKRRDK